MYEIYMGPKERAFLEDFGHDAERSIDYGWFESSPDRSPG